MTAKPVDILGGESVYCINEGQIESARALAFEDPESAPRIQAELERLERSLSRNEQAALSFVLIQRLIDTSPYA